MRSRGHADWKNQGNSDSRANAVCSLSFLILPDHVARLTGVCFIPRRTGALHRPLTTMQGTGKPRVSVTRRVIKCHQQLLQTPLGGTSTLKWLKCNLLFLILKWKPWTPKRSGQPSSSISSMIIWLLPELSHPPISQSRGILKARRWERFISMISYYFKNSFLAYIHIICINVTTSFNHIFLTLAFSFFVSFPHLPPPSRQSTLTA